MTLTSTVLVASVSILRDNEVLLIQENKPSARNLWNFPSGRVEPGEAVIEAAIREVREETGYEVQLTGTTGVYPFISCTGSPVLLFHFTADIVGGTLEWATDEIMDARWVPLRDILQADRIELRGADVMRQIAENLLVGRIHSLAFYNRSLLK